MNKIILVTGGSRGIGLAIAKKFAPDFDKVFLVARDEDGLMQAKLQVSENARARVYILPCDFKGGSQSAKAVRDWISGAADHIDLLVLNAGYYIEGKLGEVADQDFRDILEVNFLSNYFLVKELLPLIRRSATRRVVMMGSTGAYEAYPGAPACGVTKWALRGLAINLREELMGEQIGVTLLSPGATATRMWEGEDVPANRLLNPNDIAEVVATVMRLSPQAVLDEVVMRPMHGEPHA
jgi:NAD(P)-dependent dehydrogenase (short-subunit alcohol dehydrogenase family)